MSNIALLALEASDATVVLTSVSLVFGMLVALCLIITLEGKIFDSLSAKKNPPKAPKAPAAPAPQAPAAPKAPGAAPAAAQAPAKAAGGIPGEIIATIAAAVASLEGEGAVIRGIRRISKPASGSRRGAWGDAGVREQTTPFM
ncbi:MAG: OadG family transporter subunit [Gemmiger sp.]